MTATVGTQYSEPPFGSRQWECTVLREAPTNSALYQGTTSVVPKLAQKPERFSPWDAFSRLNRTFLRHTVQLLLLPIFLLGLLSSPAQAKAKKFVIAAYVFPGKTLLAPQQVAAKKLTRINFAFANIDHGVIVEGEPADAANMATLVALKKENPELTVLVSVGGWLWSGRFSDVALTPANRKKFIDSVAAFIADHNLDGLDIDWEFPAMAGAPGNVFRPEDKQNYTLLLKGLRERFKKMQRQLHRRLYLSVAAGASSDFLQHTEMSKVQKYVDTVNLMAYDYYEPGDEKITGNHAPLFVDPADPAGVSADRSVQEFEAAGVPADKIVLGVPFYGHEWGDVAATDNGLFQPGQPVPHAYSGYGAIASTMLNQGYIRYWDKAASVPYLYNPQKRIFVSYEDPASLAVKCNYVVEHRLAGMMFWEYGSDPTGALLDAIDLGLGDHPIATASGAGQ